MTALGTRLETALHLVTQAGDMAMRMRPPPGAATASLKGAQDWVTEADGAVERFLSEQIAIAFPDDGFQGEEDGSHRTGRLRWVVDPIDGTSNYMRGSNRFCVSLGLLEDRQPLLGVIVDPARSAWPMSPLGGSMPTANSTSIYGMSRPRWRSCAKPALRSVHSWTATALPTATPFWPPRRESLPRSPS